MSIGYVPDGKLIGLSKLIRIMRHHCKRITIQERITEQTVDTLERILQPKGVIVRLRAEHTCMALRGVKSPGSVTTTSAYRGVFATDLDLRNQFLQETK